MANISIYEQDLTATTTVEELDDVVYVPGYAVWGPINEPTLCSTLEEFQSIFGSQPYKFKENQKYPTAFNSTAIGSNNIIANAGSYEKSYIYACELLNRGLPVLFERVTSNTTYASLNISSSTGSSATNDIVIAANYPGEYGTNIKVSLVSSAGGNYQLTVTDGYTTDYITFNKTSYVNYNGVALQLITVNFPSTFADQSYATVQDSALTIATSTTDEFTVSDFYNKIAGKVESNVTTPSILDKLIDRNEYNYKFLTLGGYPSLEYDGTVYLTGYTYPVQVAGSASGTETVSGNNLAKAMLNVAARRGAVVLLDHINNTSRSLTGSGSLYESMNSSDTESLALWENSTVKIGSKEKEEDCRPSGAILSPWYIYKPQASYIIDGTISQLSNQIMTGSFAYLSALAQSMLSGNKDWLAIAGVQRGMVPGFIQPVQNQFITTAVDTVWSSLGSESAPKVSINPIMNIRPYGYLIWENRTLNVNKGSLTAMSPLNSRIVIIDCKKAIYEAAVKYRFENNSDVLWLNFKTEIQKTLDDMVDNNVLETYTFRREESTERAVLKVIITIYLQYAIEGFDIELDITDSYVSVE